MLQVSTPSRICLFGEHQDYLGLDVVALAIDLRFRACASERDDQLINIAIRDSRIDTLGAQNTENAYERHSINLAAPIVYSKDRDYLKSAVNTLLRRGYALRGLDIKMDSEIPIGKGMCSSSTMIVALIKALLESIGSPDKDNPGKIAELAFSAEVLEFHEPGGMMDHLTSTWGGLVHMNFADNVKVIPLTHQIDCCFILFDSLQQKDTTRILAESKRPTLEAIDNLRPYGVTSVKDFFQDPSKMELLSKLDTFQRRKLTANINNYRILHTALADFQSGMTPARLGALILEHQENLRDGLGISTPEIDNILDTAMQNGALGGKINGSGGGGCLYACAMPEDAPRIIEAVSSLGYPSKILRQDTGVRVDKSPCHI